MVLTVCASAAEVLGRYDVLPKYSAVIECFPTANPVVANVALPPDSVTVDSVVVPFLKTTEPVGVPPPGATAATVAVNFTNCPNTDGFSDDVRLVVLAALLTVCASAAEVLGPYVVLPEYTAVMEWPPTTSAEVASVALPPLTVREPSTAVPSLKDTVPVIVPAVVELTVAVKITGCSKTVVLTEEARLVVDGTLESCACADGVVMIIGTNETAKASAAFAGRHGILEIEPRCCTMLLIDSLLFASTPDLLSRKCRTDRSSRAEELASASPTPPISLRNS